MDQPAFDALTQRMAGQMTRRAALASLLGGALLLHDPASSEANRRARRRRRRRNRNRRRNQGIIPLKPISLWIDTMARTSPVTVEHGYITNAICRTLNTVTIAPGERVRFDAPNHLAYVWIADTFWLSFRNLPLERPDASAAMFGMTGYRIQCKPPGTTYLDQQGMNEGQTIPVDMDGHLFSVRRDTDTNYKVFTVKLPTDI